MDRGVTRIIPGLVFSALAVSCGPSAGGGTDACSGVTCSGHGTCSEVDGKASCTCDSGYSLSGATECVAKPCTGVTCSGHGTCSEVDGKASCTCDSGYSLSGATECVAKPCTGVTCSGHGICSEVDGKASCICDSGYGLSGATECVAKPCTGVTCSGHGICSELEGKASCTCDSGYSLSGATECVAKPCTGVTCSGHGTCSEVDSKASCTCDSGYSLSGATECVAAHTVTLDKYSLMIDGKRLNLWAGEFHYWRLPSPGLWRDVLEKLKAAGYNAANIYFHWGYHSPAPGVYDFTGIRNVDQLLSIASEVGIYVIARPGPYINAETDGGGLPAWLDRLPGRKRSPDPDYLAYADEWLSQINPILARHQLTNGTGTIILAQVENEFSDNSTTGRAYMQHLIDKFRADGITVPLTGNHWNHFNTGPEGMLDVDGWDPYPQGFDCSHPTQWAAVPDFTWLRDELTDRPLFFPEFQGGAFDPWGGPGYEACRALTGPDFQKVFYSTNIAVGSTMQSFYMTYGGTSWGYLPFPGVYTSYDYGSAITESRQLTTKYDQQKLFAYLLAAAPSLTKTELLSLPTVTNSAIWARARMNPDDNTHLYVLRHQDGSSTRRDETHLSLDLSGRTGFSHDDVSQSLTYTGSDWFHATGQSWTSGDYLGTETFSATAGESVSFAFHGPAVRWISSLDSNHGIAAVSIDGTQVATVDTWATDKQYQYVAYQAFNLTDADHILTITVAGQRNASATGSYVVVDAIDVPPVASGQFYASVPQKPGTAIAIDGRDAKLLLARFAFGAGQRLVYSTSQLLTTAALDGTDLAVLYGPAGEAGETVLRYATQPTVEVLSGTAVATWDSGRGDLRLNYPHAGLARVRVSAGGASDLVLLLADQAVAAQFWLFDTSAGPVLARGPQLVRAAAANQGVLALRGDTTQDTTLELYAPAALRTVTWNGSNLAISGPTDPAGGPATAILDGPAAVSLPDLTWRYQLEAPEADPVFDDQGWALASHASSLNTDANGRAPVLGGDEYGFHYGHVWYRGHFTAYGTETGVLLEASTGGARAGQYAVWLNGTYLGSRDGSAIFPLAVGAVNPNQDNVISVLVANVGHDQGTSKVQRGLTSARLNGSDATIVWRVQGNLGGEALADPVRGPFNSGGLFGERAGWHLPGFPDEGWMPVTLPHADSRPGIAWYRSHFHLNLPQGQDVPVALRFADDPSRHYRAQIFLNGWNMGLYVNDVGPQHDFVLPAGLLRTSGDNTLALAVWSSEAATGGLGTASLVQLGNARGGVQVGEVAAPGYDAAKYAQPLPPAHLTLSGPDLTVRGTSATVKVALSVPPDRPAVSSAAVSLTLPQGWTVAGDATASLGPVEPGQSATAQWTVTTPTGEQPMIAFLLAQAALTVQGQSRSVDAGKVVTVPAPAPTGNVYVSDRSLSATNGWGPVELDTSNGEDSAGDGRTMTLGTTSYAKGLGAHAASEITVYLGGNCTAFTSTVGVDAETNGGGSVRFHVIADGVEVAGTGILTGTSAPASLMADVTGAKWLELLVDDAGDGNALDHADWADAMIHCN